MYGEVRLLAGPGERHAAYIIINGFIVDEDVKARLREIAGELE
jgi:hypothetical protein